MESEGTGIILVTLDQIKYPSSPRSCLWQWPGADGCGKVWVKRQVCCKTSDYSAGLNAASCGLGMSLFLFLALSGFFCTLLQLFCEPVKNLVKGNVLGMMLQCNIRGKRWHSCTACCVEEQFSATNSGILVKAFCFPLCKMGITYSCSTGNWEDNI